MLDPLSAPMHDYIYPSSESGSVRCTPLPPPGCASSGLRTPPCSPCADGRDALAGHTPRGLRCFDLGQVRYDATRQSGPRWSLGHSVALIMIFQCMWQGTSAAELPGWHVAALVNAFDSAINERLPGRSSSQLALTGAVARRARLHRHPHDHTKSLHSEVKRRSHGDVTSFGGRLGRTTRRHGTLPVTDPQRMCTGA